MKMVGKYISMKRKICILIENDRDKSEMNKPPKNILSLKSFP